MSNRHKLTVVYEVLRFCRVRRFQGEVTLRVNLGAARFHELRDELVASGLLVVEVSGRRRFYVASAAGVEFTRRYEELVRLSGNLPIGIS